MTLNDLGAVIEWSRDEVFCRANGWPVGRTADMITEHWRGILLHPAQDFLRLGVEAGGRLVGFADLAHIRDGRASLGIAIGDRRLWGQGVGIGAARLMLAQAFDGLGLRSVRAQVHETNLRSLTLIRGLGFRPAGAAPEPDMYEGAPVQILHFALDAARFGGAT